MKKDFFKEYGFRIVFVVVFLLSFVWMGTKQTIMSNSNSVEDWLPPHYQETRDYQWYLNNFPFESYVVVSWEGCEIDDDRIELFAQKLCPEQTIDNYSLSSSVESFKADLKLTRAPDEAKVELSEMTGERTNTATSALIEATGSEVVNSESADAPTPSYFKSVMTGPRLVKLLSQAYARTERRPQLNQSRNELDDASASEIDRKIRERLKGTLIGPDGKSTALIVTLNKGQRDGKSAGLVLDKIREISTECGLPDTREVHTGSFASQMVKNFVAMCDEIAHGRKVRMDGVILGGPPVDNVALDQEGQRTLFRLAGVCALIGVTIAFVCLRSFRLTMFVFWIAALSAGVALAIVSLTGGTCDSILLSMPALVYVLGMSGAVHLINYYHDAIRESGLIGATERAVRHAFTPCFFAQFTTALGLGSLFAGRLVPITKFGFYSAIGVLCTLLLLFLYLPALLYFYPSKKFAEEHGGKGLHVNEGKILRFWNWFGGLIIRRHNWALLLCFGLMIFFGYYLPKIKTSVKMMSFFSPDADIIQNYTWLEEKLGPLVPMEMVLCFDNSKLYDASYRTAERLELVDRISEKLKSELSEDVGGTLSVALFTPNVGEMATKGGAAYRTISTVVGKTVDDNRDALRDYLTIEGNPTLEELRAYLAENATSKREAFERERAAFEESLGNKPDFNYDFFKRTNENELDENLAPHYAQFQTLERLELEAEQASQEARAVGDNVEYLTNQGATDLKGLLAATKSSRYFRKLSADENVALANGVERWRRERGVEIWRISIRVWSLKKDIDYSAFIERVKDVVEPILAEESLTLAAAFADKNAHERATAEQLIADARQYVQQRLAEAQASKAKAAPTERALMREYTLKDLSDAERETLRNSMGKDHDADWIYPAGFSAKYTGMVPLVYQTQHELIKGLTSSLIMAFVLIAIVFIFLLRSVPAGLIAMIPNVFPVIVVFGYMSYAGILVDVGTMMTASVALGVAVDDTMHYLTWFSDGVSDGKTPKEAALNAYRRCATAMTQSTLIAGLGLSSFAFSTFIPTQRFGILMLAILFTAVFGDLVFLPALLTCKPFGRFFVNRRIGLRAKKSEQKA